MLVVYPTWALHEARLLRQSTSGQSVLLNLGRFDGVAEGEHAVLVKQIRDLNARDLRVVPVARARNIKQNTDSSVWLLYQIFDPELLIPNDKFIVLSENEFLSGRKGPNIGRVTVVTNNKGEVIGALQDDAARLQKLKDKYQKGARLHGKEQVGDQEGELVDVDSWNKVKNDRYRVALYKSPTESEFMHRIRLETFEKMVTAYMRKINDPEFNYEKFYEDSMREEKLNEFQRNHQLADRNGTEPRMNAPLNAELDKRRTAMMEKSLAWSEGYSDEELSEALTNFSLSHEKERREYRDNKPKQYAVNIDLAFNLTDNQTQKSSYHRDNRYSYEGSFEVTPFINRDELQHLTLFGGLRRNLTAFDTGGANASMDETSFSLGANWYPLYAPNTYEAASIFLGTFVRTGFATVQSPSASESARYSVISVPGVQAGMKYLFRNHFGLRIVSSMETLNVNNYQSKTGSTLPKNTKFTEGKVGFGMTYVF
jgi:hypothetical protein